MVPEIVTRRASPADLVDVLALLRRALGWSDRDTRFLEWKHLDNSFGPSPMWIALAGARVVGFRAFLRWELRGSDGRVWPAVRAVDTATDPDFQGRGIFTALTRTAIDELAAEGVALVFNTPNARSLPGYRKLGWREVGRLPTAVRPARWRFAVVAARSRTAAARAPVPSSVGEPASAGLADSAALDRLLARLDPPAGLSTHRSAAYLAWRYGNADLGYRSVRLGTAAEDGMALFRLRRRGNGIEGVVCELLIPRGDSRGARELVGRLARSREADYLIRLQEHRVTRDGFVRLPQVGPVLVCRSLTGAPTPDRGGWALSMGDVEML